MKSALGFLRSHPLRVKQFIVLFYIIGLIAIYIPYTSAFFISLTPLALLLSFGLLMVFHKKFDFKTLAVFSFIFITGFLVEMVGTRTGLIFGHYFYGTTLGLSIANTPLMIGLNWVMMIYITAAPVRKLKIHSVFKVLLSSVLMIGYDVVLERVAPAMDMWSWEGGQVPLQNYLGWFVLSVLFHSLLKITNIKTKNELSVLSLGTQFFFFVFLLAFSK